MQSQLETVFRERLKIHQFRVTPNRLRVFRALMASAQPLTVTDLASRLAAEGLNIATVYRIMEAFVALNIVHPVLIDHQSVGYELVEPFRAHHDHLVCTRCGQVVDLYNCQLDQALAAMSRLGGYQVAFHQMEIHGLCPDCTEEAPHKTPSPH